MHAKLLILALFLITYFLIVVQKKHSLSILYISILILLISPAITFLQAFHSINLNVLGIFWGTMVLSQLFIHSGVPDLLSTKLASRTGSATGAMLAICGLSSFISIYTDNVATVLIVGPLALELARKLELNPVPFIIGVAISSNLQGCATMIGDAPSIILATSSNMNFNDFFWMQGRPGLFFAVQLGAVGSFLILYLAFKKYHKKVQGLNSVPIKSWFPTLMIAGLVTSLVLASFIPIKPKYTIGIICVLWGIIGLIWHSYSHRESINLMKNLDWRTLFFLIGVFVLIGSLTHAGIIRDLANLMIKLAQQNPLQAFLILVIVSVIASAFIDNIPYTMAMIPVAKLIAQSMNTSPYPYLFGLLIGACLGGNITPIGASCNIAGVGLLRKYGYTVSFKDFIKLGLPFTVIAVTLASLFIWFVWMNPAPPKI